MLSGFILFVVSAVGLCNEASYGSTFAHPSTYRYPDNLFIPIVVVLVCFSMDTLNLGLKHKALSGWGSLGFSAACFLVQGLATIFALRYIVPALALLLVTPWLTRLVIHREFGAPAIESSALH